MENTRTDWYKFQSQLSPGDVFLHVDGGEVKLLERVPGDGSQWHVADWYDGWAYYDRRIEPGDLVRRLE